MTRTNPPTSCIRSSTRRKTNPNRCSPTWPRRRRQRRPRAWRCGAPRWRPTPTCWSRPPPRWRAASRRADGCSPSETAAAAPIPPRWRDCSPGRRSGSRCPAWSLTADQAIVTALGNDVGFELVFARQLIARAKAGDIAIAMSTSGNSPNLLTALAEARQRGLYTIGFAGYDGGAFADNPNVDACFVVRSQSVHRIQESQALLGYQLWLACINVSAIKVWGRHEQVSRRIPFVGAAVRRG